MPDGTWEAQKANDRLSVRFDAGGRLAGWRIESRPAESHAEAVDVVVREAAEPAEIPAGTFAWPPEDPRPAPPRGSDPPR